MNGFPPRFPEPPYGHGDVPPTIPDPMDDPDLREVAQVVREVLHEHRMRPAARDQLRAQLIAAAAAQVSPPQELRAQRPEPVVEPRLAERPAPARPAASGPGTGRVPVAGPRQGQPGAHRERPSGRPTSVRPAAGRPSRPAAAPRPTARRRPPHRVPALGWSAIGAAAALTAVLLVVRGFPGGGPGYGIEQVAAQVLPGFLGPNSVDPTDAVTLKFSRPLDRATVQDALRIAPATTVTTSWKGNALTVTPSHGFAANSAYVLTIDHTKAKTADGHALASDVRVVFGTAPLPPAQSAMGTPATLNRSEISPADAGSEAVVTRDGAVLLTAAKSRHGQSASLMRVDGQKSTTISAAVDAICVSRSGKSVAYLSHDGNQAQVVIADATGTAQSHLAVKADPSSPIGWINDDEVTFVSEGKLRAVDRNGHIRTLGGVRVDAAHDILVLAPGGRYAYLARGTAPGQVIDLSTGTSHALGHAVGSPAFSADGATVFWVERHSSNLHLDSAPSGGGPILSVPLPDLTGSDTVSDLAVSPDSSMLVYTVTHADKSSQLRLASLPTAATVAESDGAGGQSPNWGPAGRMFTVLAHGSTGSRIESVRVPQNLAGSGAAMGAVAQAFVNAQISGDRDAQRALSASGVKPPELPQVSRATVLYVKTTGDGTATVTVRLSVDPTTTDPVVKKSIEKLDMRLRGGTSLPEVTAISLKTFAPAPPGPALTRVDTTTVPGAALLTFDSDLNASTVPTGIALVSSSGQEIPATASYDAQARTVTLQPATPGGAGSGSATVELTTSLRDVDGTPLPAATEIPVQLASTGQ